MKFDQSNKRKRTLDTLTSVMHYTKIEVDVSNKKQTILNYKDR